jgi:crotonobetainyl-CoA:carnitine CoA-transferase CaiB-like acyl-CoA transferase
VNPSGALDGVRVLGLSGACACAVAGMLLADLGADVLHAEPVERDLLREPGYLDAAST